MRFDWEHSEEGEIMFDRKSAIRSLATKAAVGAALAASLAVAACGGTTTGGGGTTTASPLTACHATVADVTATANGHATATGASLTGKLNIDGSSALQPLFSQAVNEFSAANS